MAFFKGGAFAFWELMSKHIHYLSSATRVEVEGLVLASLVLHPDGSFGDLNLEVSLHPDLDQSVLAAIQATSGHWNVAGKGGVARPIKLMYPVWFMLGPDPVQPKITSLPQGVYLKEKAIRMLFRGPRYVGQDRTLKNEEEERNGLTDFINQHITYPPAALAAHAEGVEVIEFMVRTDGSLSDFNVLHSKHPAAAEEVIRVVKATSGDWEPGIQDRQKKEMKGRVQVRFRLDQRDAYVWKGYWF
ncbi:hypothetical protein BH24BAC1_BH24BAC1_39830 [soil metagenome]